jgi:hypothetical protein
MVRGKPAPFPPEPLRSAVIQLTRASLARADRHEGRRDLWLRTLDRLGLALIHDLPARGAGGGFPPIRGRRGFQGVVT